VVRNRLYSMGGRFEVTPTLGLTIVNRLTDAYNFNVGFGYNMTDTLAVEVRGGYALTRHTGLADQISQHLLQRNPVGPGGGLGEVAQTDDLAGLWEMKGNGVLGLRWAPIYGKLGLMSELPVHFQFYLWGGGGAGSFQRTSVVICNQVTSRSDGTCGAWASESKTSWLASAAVGFRFFTSENQGLRLEVRDYSYPDSFKVNIDRRLSEAGQPTGTPASSPGLTNLVLFDLGYSFIF
jgi:outer membrane beta-barrel protein